jgi:hypothetical protein
LSGCTSLAASIFISPEVIKHTLTLRSLRSKFWAERSLRPLKACLHQLVIDRRKDKSPVTATPENQIVDFKYKNGTIELSTCDYKRCVEESNATIIENENLEGKSVPEYQKTMQDSMIAGMNNCIYTMHLFG